MSTKGIGMERGVQHGSEEAGPTEHGMVVEAEDGESNEAFADPAYWLKERLCAGEGAPERRGEDRGSQG